jgi:hypothetical protein
VGATGTPEGTAPTRFGTVRPGVQIPGPRPKIVFKIDDFFGGLESAAHSRITISCRPTKPARGKGVCRGQAEIARP